jgi:hypothetical protein
MEPMSKTGRYAMNLFRRVKYNNFINSIELKFYRLPSPSLYAAYGTFSFVDKLGEAKTRLQVIHSAS